MKTVCVCGRCGRTIETEFLYCPWCGTSKMKNDSDEYMEAMFKNLEYRQIENRNRRLEKLEKELEELDRDLSILALSAEMAK